LSSSTRVILSKTSFHALRNCVEEG